MEKVKAGDEIRRTKVFSITPYSSVGTVEEFRRFTTGVCDYAEELVDGKISVDVEKDDAGRVMQIDFIVEGRKVCDEVEANFHNEIAEQDARAQLDKDITVLKEIQGRSPNLFIGDPKFLEY